MDPFHYFISSIDLKISNLRNSVLRCSEENSQLKAQPFRAQIATIGSSVISTRPGPEVLALQEETRLAVNVSSQF